MVLKRSDRQYFESLFGKKVLDGKKIDNTIRFLWSHQRRESVNPLFDKAKLDRSDPVLRQWREENEQKMTERGPPKSSKRVGVSQKSDSHSSRTNTKRKANVFTFD